MKTESFSLLLILSFWPLVLNQNNRNGQNVVVHVSMWGVVMGLEALVRLDLISQIAKA